MFNVLAVIAGLAGGMSPSRPLPPPCARPDDMLLTGTVRDSITGVQLREAHVIAIARANGGNAIVHEIRAGGHGRFRFCIPRAPTRVYANYLGKMSRITSLALDTAPDSLDIALDVSPAVGARLTGRAVEGGGQRAVKGALVALQPLGLTQLTDGNGRFAFVEVPPGSYQVAVTHPAFQSRLDSLALPSGALVEMVAPLSVQVVALEPLIVRSLSRRLETAGFYRRQRSGAGVFITRTEIEKLPPTALPSDIARSVAGVRTVRRASGRGTRLAGRNMCAYRYFVDDVRMGTTFELDDLILESIEAVEIYNGIGAIPPQFAAVTPADMRSCGVIVVWTRVR